MKKYFLLSIALFFTASCSINPFYSKEEFKKFIGQDVDEVSELLKKEKGMYCIKRIFDVFGTTKYSYSLSCSEYAHGIICPTYMVHYLDYDPETRKIIRYNNRFSEKSTGFPCAFK